MCRIPESIVLDRNAALFFAVDETGCSLADKGGIRVDDDGVSLGRVLGARRLKGLLFLSRHPELDGAEWSGRVEIHFANGGIVKGAVLPAADEIVGF